MHKILGTLFLRESVKPISTALSASLSLLPGLFPRVDPQNDFGASSLARWAWWHCRPHHGLRATAHTDVEKRPASPRRRCGLNSVRKALGRENAQTRIVVLTIFLRERGVS